MARRLTAAAAVLLLLAACGGSPTASSQSDDGGVDLGDNFADVFAEVEDLSGPERRKALLEQAQDEEDITWYTSLNEDVARNVISVFSEATGLDVTLYRAGSEDVRNRLIEEARAGHVGADVVENNGPEMLLLARENVFAPFTSPVQDNLVEDSVRETWTATRFNIFTVAWNTNLVAQGEQTQVL